MSNQIEIPSDPCSNCHDKPSCKTTCDRASKWWKRLANIIGGKVK